MYGWELERRNNHLFLFQVIKYFCDMKKIDLTNKRFGRLIVISESKEYTKSKNIHWTCKCDCGNIVNVSSYCLLKGRTKSCGCLRKERMSETMTTHGLTGKTPLYSTWRKIKERCFNKNAKGYCNYGGRGITICDEWKNDFHLFYDWSIKNGYAKGLSIDRIDNDGNYEPINCRWVSMKIQQRNRRNNKIIEYKGENKPLSEWCEIFGVDYNTIHQRINKYGWTFEDAIFK
jgi:hypothetical protein